jgi:hypothetical protein
MNWISKFILLACTVLAIAGNKALAHISYNNRNFGTLIISADVSNTTQVVSSGFGWADATDADWGDSHRGRFFRFTLANPLTADQSVRIIAERNLNTSASGSNGTFLPGFSLFSGLAHTTSPLAHDSSALSVQWLQQQFGTNSTGLGGSGKEGSFNALGDWSIGNSVSTSLINVSDSLRNLTYIGHAADGTSADFGNAVGIVGDGTADGFVTATFSGLAAGDYSLFVGGANYAAQTTEVLTTEVTTYPTYGVNVTVGLVPEPSTGSLLLGGAALLGLLRRRRG